MPPSLRSRNSEPRVPSSESRVRVSEFGVRVSESGARVSESRVPSSASRVPTDECPDAPIQRRLGALSPEFASPSPETASLNLRLGEMKIRFVPPGRRHREYDRGSGISVTGSGY